MKFNDERRALATARGNNPIPNVQEDGWAPERGCTFLKREKSLGSAGIRTPYSPSRGSVTIPTRLPRLPLTFHTW